MSTPNTPLKAALKPALPKKRLITRRAYICKYCEGVYADEPVSSCDCLGHLGGAAPHFIKGKIEYSLPKT